MEEDGAERATGERPHVPCPPRSPQRMGDGLAGLRASVGSGKGDGRLPINAPAPLAECGSAAGGAVPLQPPLLLPRPHLDEAVAPPRQAVSLPGTCTPVLVHAHRPQLARHRTQHRGGPPRAVLRRCQREAGKKTSRMGGAHLLRPCQLRTSQRTVHYSRRMPRPPKGDTAESGDGAVDESRLGGMRLPTPAPLPPRRPPQPPLRQQLQPTPLHPDRGTARRETGVDDQPCPQRRRTCPPGGPRVRAQRTACLGAERH